MISKSTKYRFSVFKRIYRNGYIFVWVLSEAMNGIGIEKKHLKNPEHIKEFIDICRYYIRIYMSAYIVHIAQHLCENMYIWMSMWCKIINGYGTPRMIFSSPDNKSKKLGNLLAWVHNCVLCSKDISSNFHDYFCCRWYSNGLIVLFVSVFGLMKTRFAKEA